jgi:16S rRNA (uracil1498-N3)-methyltransferase
MPRNVRVFVTPLVEGEQKLELEAAHYLNDVHRLRNGETFTAFDPLARLEADAMLLESEPKRARCRIGELRVASNVSTLGITLIQGMGKADKVEQVLRSATALGVTAISVVETERSVARIKDRGPDKRARWQAVLIDAARQSGRGDLPELRGPWTLDAELEARKGSVGLGLCLQPDASERFVDAVRAYPIDQPISILVGPEGGFSSLELERVRSAGFRGVRFGAFTLRTELAGVAVLGALVAERSP